MRIVIRDHNSIELIPDNDADKALLGMWSEMGARIESSSYSNGTTISILIGFYEKDKVNVNQAGNK